MKQNIFISSVKHGPDLEREEDIDTGKQTYSILYIKGVHDFSCETILL